MKPVILLMGPTASGKTGVALSLAQALPVEIISVDSALIYRGMDIGTAKPSAAELAQVPHHLIDILDPAQSYSAAQFRADALRLIDEIHARGKLPLLVGGTMLYFKALREGLDVLPQANAVLRAQLDAEAQRAGWPALHARLAQVDAPTAARLAPNDAQRIQRALEIYELTGTPMSSLLQQQVPQPTQHHYLPLALEPSDRVVLHQRIEQRFDAMLAGNFLEEVRRLRARGDLHPGLPSIRCVGYRQAWEFLDEKCSATEMRDKAIAATRQLAKRQLTWLRGMDDRKTFDCLQVDLAQAVLHHLQQCSVI
ncbi:MAG: tRNA (adenosine(37)-N6)-dimethylallyltransferase MiaA [Burkholderiaceae bacterium]|nr:MAG: tRNA (adenosine(37)-N6)-dimethylallyltransferase MiaA [Burkholderiaceae bacterium]